jgi:MYXO-CTERM domain-containing protein
MNTLSAWCLLLLAWSLALPGSARANGRMPGANELAFDHARPEHLVVRASFGVVETFDRGDHWRWTCEEVVGTSGVIADPPLAVVGDGSIVLLPPTGSALVSRDAGCSWQTAVGPLADNRGVDLTHDPSDPARLLALTSTIDSVDDKGYPLVRNTLVETRDDARSWTLLSTLPSDFEAETVEVAPSDARRIYVSGTDSKDPRRGLLLRSEDGGASWQTSSLMLPPGSGSLFISAIHPLNPDMLWVRVPARGDTIGILPAELLMSSDKGQTFRQLAATQRAMFGFALSPDGSELAFGGPSDGLFVGPSDGSGGFRKLSGLTVRCLRWTADDALYVCAFEPNDPFTMGVSRDRGITFEPLYRLSDTCPQACSADAGAASSCRAAGNRVGPLIGAAGTLCEVPWTTDTFIADAAIGGGAPGKLGPDAASMAPRPGSADGSIDAGLDASAARPGQAETRAGAGCSCQLAGKPRESGWLEALLAVLLVLFARADRRRRSVRC